MSKQRNGLSESEAGKLGFLASSKTRNEQKEKRITEYYKNPNCCSHCGKVLPYVKKNNKFCSTNCAAKYNNKIRTKESREKQKATLLNTLRTNKSKNAQTKKCKWCGAEKGHCERPDVCNKYRIFNTLSIFGFDKNKIGTTDIFYEYDKTVCLIKQEYANHIDDKTLSDRYGYKSGVSNFHKILKSLDIQTRNHSESLSEAYMLGKINVKSEKDACPYKNCWHTTWNGKRVYLRSSYELDFAKTLDLQKIDYDVECLRIKYFDTFTNKYKCAIPDFFIPTTNEIFEIKSNWTLNLQNMKDKFFEYEKLGYKPHLILEHKEVDVDLL